MIVKVVSGSKTFDFVMYLKIYVLQPGVTGCFVNQTLASFSQQ